MMSHLFIMRHGSAEYSHPNGDSQRNLNVHGVDEAILVGKVFDQIGAPDLVIHSPYVRTTQTAAHVVEQLSSKPVVLSAAALKSGTVPEDILSEIQGHTGFERVLAVGHMPDVAELTLMLTGSEDLPAMFVPATVVSLDLTEGWDIGAMGLCWMETPVTIQGRL